MGTSTRRIVIINCGCQLSRVSYILNRLEFLVTQTKFLCIALEFAHLQPGKSQRHQEHNYLNTFVMSLLESSGEMTEKMVLHFLESTGGENDTAVRLGV